MKVLVTGGSGYVGSVLVPALHKAGHTVRVLESMQFGNPIGDLPVEFIKGDITNSADVAQAVRGQDAVIHLAGVVTDDLVDMNANYGWKVNVEGTTILSDEAQLAGVKTFVYASSSSVYGKAASENEVVSEDIIPKPQTAYAKQKFLAEFRINAPRVVIVRSATCCGPAPRMRLDTVVNVFSKQAYFDGKITVHGGDQYRSNVHVSDVANFYQMALERDDLRGVFNITCDNMKVKQIAHEVAGAAVSMDIPRPEVIIQDVPDPRSYRLDASKARNAGWIPKRSIWQAAVDNFEHFATSKLDPNSDIYFNSRRMKETVLRGS